MFKWTVTGLMKKTENVLKQNNTMNIEEIYFEDFDEEENLAKEFTKATTITN